MASLGEPAPVATPTPTPAPAESSAVTSTAPAPVTWRSLREPGSGGRISSVAISPFDANRVLIGGDMLGVGLTTNGGASWQATTGFASWEINDFTWHPTSQMVVWVGTLSGPYRSADAGRTWTAKRVGLPVGDFPYSAPIQKVLIDPSNTTHLLAFGGNQRRAMIGGTGALNFGTVYESSDGGNTWSTLSSVGTDVNILDVVTVGGNLDTIYVAALDKGVLRSVDGGRTWSSVNIGLPNLKVRGLETDPTHPGTMWAAVERDETATAGVYRPGGIFRTTDGGATWTAANTGLPQYADAVKANSTSMMSIHRSADGTLFTADQGYKSQARFRSVDGGLTWTPANTAFAKFYPASGAPYVWATSSDSRRVVGGTSDTILGSSDAGTTWKDLGNVQDSTGAWKGTGFSGLVANRVTFNRTRPGLMLLSSMDAGNVLRSADGGASWSRPMRTWDQYGGGYDVASGGATGEVAYAVLGQAGRFNGIAVSTTAGVSWTGRAGDALPARGSGGVNQGAVAIAGLDGATAYAVLPNGKLYKTTDTGATWSLVGLPATARSVAASSDGLTVWVGTDAGVYVSVAGGAWSLSAGSPTSARRLVVGTNGALLAVGSATSGSPSAGLWRLEGGVWTRIAVSRIVNDVAMDPNDANTIVYVTNDNPYHDKSLATGVWISRDGGQTFSQQNLGLAMTRVASVAIDPSVPGRIVIGTNGRGFWETTLAAPA